MCLGTPVISCFIQDTQGKKALEGTMHLYEVASCATEDPRAIPRVWTAKVANLPCNFRHSCFDLINTECTWTPWREARKITVIEGLKDGEMALRGLFKVLFVSELKYLPIN